MSDLGFELEEIARLIKLVEQRGLSELIVEEADRRIVIRGVGYRRQRPAPPAAEPAEAAHAPAAPEHVAHEAHPAAPEKKGVPVFSPMVGVFYRSPSPDAPPYVDVGDRVEVGQTIGMIEAMKVFSEIPSDTAGTVAEVVVESGQLVKPNEPILYLMPDS